jgi:hypothetical protein
MERVVLGSHTLRSMTHVVLTSAM